MAKDYAALAKQAAELTNKELSSELTDLSALSRNNLAELLPAKKDKEGFVELMTIVQKETDEDVAAAKLTENIATFGKVVVKVLKFFA